MSDFNLMAAINLQLATGAGAKLVSEINSVLAAKSFDVTVNVKDSFTMSGGLAKLFPKSGTPNIKLNVNLSNETDISAKVNALVKDRSFKIDLIMDKSTITNLDNITKALERMKNVVGDLSDIPNIKDAFTKKGTLPTGSDYDLDSKGKRKSAFSKRGQELKDLRSHLQKLARLPGDFYKFADEHFNSILKDAGGVTSLKGLSAELFEKAVLRLEGVTKRPIQNTIKGLEELYAALTKLNRVESTLGSKGVLAGDSGNLVKARLDESRARILKLRDSADFSDVSALKTQLRDIDSETNNLVSDTKSYQEELRKLKAQRLGVIAKGGSDIAVETVERQIELVKKLRSEQNLSTPQIKNNNEFLANNAALENLKTLDSRAAAAYVNLDKLETKLGQSAIYKSYGAEVLGTADKVQTLIDKQRDLVNSQVAQNNPHGVSNISRGIGNTTIKIKSLEEQAKALDEVFQNLDKKKEFYDKSGLTQASAAVSKFRDEVIALAKAGQATSLKDSLFVRINQEIETLGQNETKINRFIGAIDRLEASLQFSLGGAGDISGLGKHLENLRAEITKQGTDPNFDERTIRNTLTKGSYLARGKDKVNKVAQKAIDSFQEEAFHGSEHRNPKAVEAFAKGEQQLRSFIATQNTSTDSYKEMNDQIRGIQKETEKLFRIAKIEADGGFLGSFGKQIGFAIKRLGAFLFAARGIYGLQNAIIGAAGSAVELDSEFIKLEQIFAGSKDRIGSVEENVRSLSNEILTLGKNYGVASTEIAKSADILAQAGIKGKALEKILQVSSKARLGPTFESGVEITEAVIASLNQFELQASDVEDVIGGISQVAAQFAVESEGITKAIRRAGGAFSAGKADSQSYKDALGDFVGAFTILKSQTREADETLATSLRNILNRLQRASVQKYLRENFKIDLLDQNNQFIGFSASIEKVSNAIEDMGIKSGDPRFAALVQKLAGSLQSSRLTSLLSDAKSMSKAVAEFKDGGKTLDRDANIAFGSITNKLERAKNSIIALFTEIGRSALFKALVETLVIVSDTLTTVVSKVDKLANAFGPVVNSVIQFATFAALGNAAVRPVRAIGSGLASSGIFGPVRRAATGGLVPGLGPNIDTEPYMLAKGEYVVNKHSVNKYGKDFFNKLNQGKIKTAAIGSGPSGLISGSNTTSNLLNKVTGSLANSLDNLGRTIETSISSFKRSGRGRFNPDEYINELRSSGHPNVINRNKSQYDTSNINTGAGGPNDVYATFSRKKTTSPDKIPTFAGLGGLGHPFNGGVVQPPFSGGGLGHPGSIPSSDDSGGIGKLLSLIGPITTILGAVTVGLGIYANTSKEASDQVKILTQIVATSAAAITAYTIAVNLATKAVAAENVAKIKSLFSLKGIGAGGGIKNLVKSIGGFNLLAGAAIIAGSAVTAFADSSIEASKKIIESSKDRREVEEERNKIRYNERVKQAGIGLAAGGAGIGIGGAIGGGIGAFFGGPAGAILGAKIGAGVGGSIGASLGAYFSSPKAKKEFEKDTKLALSGADLSFFNEGASKGRATLPSELAKLKSGAKDLADITVSGLGSLTDDQKTVVKEQADQLRASLDSLDPFKRAEVLKAARDTGVNIAGIFNNIGEKFDETKMNAEIAANDLEKLFLGISAHTKNLTSVIEEADINQGILSNALEEQYSGRKYTVQEGSFNLLKQGIIPGGFAGQQLDQQLAEVRRFNPQALQNAKLEASGALVGRNLRNKLASGQINLGKDNTGKDIDASTALTETFLQELQNVPPELRETLYNQFDAYIESQFDNLTSGQDVKKIGEVIDGWGNVIDKGAIDLTKKIAESNSKFKQELDAVLKKRLEHENKIGDLVGSNVDKVKSYFEFRNKANGGLRALNPEANLAEARFFDEQKQGALLRGSGLAGNASVRDIRARYQQLNGQNDPVSMNIKDNLTKALENIANGTGSFTAALKDFDIVAEKAKRRADELSGALLGTDENLLSTIKGIYASSKIRSAKNPGEALSILQGLGDSTRSGLQSRLSNNPEEMQGFQRALGFSPILNARPEAQAVKGEFDKQIEANNALININQMLGNNLVDLSNEMVKNRMAFEGIGANINMFANAANNLAVNLANIPQNINHVHNFNVNPIQVVITGADGIGKLTGPLKDAVVEIVNNKIVGFANNLREKNKGLTVDALTSSSVTA